MLENGFDQNLSKIRVLVWIGIPSQEFKLKTKKTAIIQKLYVCSKGHFSGGDDDGNGGGTLESRINWNVYVKIYWCMYKHSCSWHFVFDWCIGLSKHVKLSEF